MVNPRYLAVARYTFIVGPAQPADLEMKLVLES